ncbi:MAG: hypothetical protein F4173_14940 [Acidobacteriia bacterium]|nr:hypothetical protein [Terriglobia bacterium]
MISLIGYTPDIFIGPIAGRLLDNFPGVAGYQYFFLQLCGISTIGMITSAAVSRAASRLEPASAVS